ncbi:glycosyltransferase [candidate division KSB1 bacterium]|nr:glycosyltransferase [candidate division KSB1 bacterium]
MSRAPLLTMIMIVKDEADYLTGCLNSVETVINELVIVDTGSSDTTCGIAEQYGAQLFSFPWNDSFADARNEALKHANGKWILFLDADERLTPESRSIISSLLLDNDAMAFDVKIRSKLKSSWHWGEYPRLFRNHPFIRFEGRIHEQIMPSIRRLRGKVKKSDVIIDHVGYAVDDDRMQAKLKRNEYLLHLQISDQPNDSYSHYCLGNVYDQMNETELAIRYYQNAAELDQQQPKIFYLLGNKFLETAQYWEAENNYQRAHELAPDVYEVLYNLAVAQIKQSRYDAAIQNFEKALKLRPQDERIQRYIQVCSKMMAQQRLQQQVPVI